MPRLTTIAIDADRSADAPVEWSGEWVQERLVHAYSVERRLPHLRRRPVASVWPKTTVEFSDIIGRADDDRNERFNAWEYAGRLGVSAADISHMEEAHDWLLVILAPYPEERLCLGQWAACVANRLSLRRLLAKRRWPRTTFYRYVTCGAHIIALELQRRGEPVS